MEGRSGYERDERIVPNDRLSRESLLYAERSSIESGEYNGGLRQPSGAGYKSRPRYYSAGSHRSRRSGYRRRYNDLRRETIPEGRDLLIVQGLAGGLLLLLVLFVSIIDTEGTVAVRQKLNAAFTKNTTFSEAADAFSVVKNTVTGGAVSAFEIFGGELEKGDDTTDTSLLEAGVGEKDDSPLLEESTGADASIDGETTIGADVTIDDATLKGIYESAEDYSKN